MTNDKTAEQLSELMRGLEIGSAAIVHLGPDGFYKIGRAIAEQAKANTRAPDAEAACHVSAEHLAELVQYDGTETLLTKEAFEGSVPLFTQPSATAVDATDAAMQRAASELPDGYVIDVVLELGGGWVDLIDPEGCKIASPDIDEGIAHAIGEAVDYAIAAIARQGEWK